MTRKRVNELITNAGFKQDTNIECGASKVFRREDKVLIDNPMDTEYKGDRFVWFMKDESDFIDWLNKI